jgi:hypothetical protein
MNIIERTLNDVTVLDLKGNLASEGAGLPPSEKGVLWRGRLEAVDGFSLGRVSLR